MKHFRIMNDSNLFLDLINILPEEVDCYIQAPSLEDKITLRLMEPTEYEYYQRIRLTKSNKDILISRVKDESVQEYFQSIEIKFADKLLFKGYDGVEYGTMSKDVNLPNWFVDKRINLDSCTISKEW